MANSGGPWTGDVNVSVSNAAGTQYNTDTRDDARLPKKSQSFSYDDDGNLTGDGVWTYTWDEMRQPTAVAVPGCLENGPNAASRGLMPLTAADHPDVPTQGPPTP